MKKIIQEVKPYHVTIRLTNEEKSSLYESVRSIVYPFPSLDYEDFVSISLKVVLKALPWRIYVELRKLRTNNRPAGALIINNLPTDKIIPPTPRNAKRSDIKKTTFISEVILTGVSALLGEPVGYEDEKERSLLHDIIPVIKTDKPLSNEGSNADFGLHIENAIFDRRERFVILFGQRQDRKKQANTPIVDVRNVLNHLTEDLISQLYLKEYVIRKPYILDHSHIDQYSEPVAILTGPRDNPQVRLTLYEGGTRATTDMGKKALEEFRQAANNNVIEYKIKRGQMVIVNNYQAMHGRTTFQAYGDGLDRYLLRSYVLESLFSVREMQRSSTRVLNRGS